MIRWPLISMVADRWVRRVWMIFLMLIPVVFCRWPATARAANTTVRWASIASR